MKIMPDASEMSKLRHPIEHDFVDVGRWKWENYPILYSLDSDTSQSRACINRSLKLKKKLEEI